MFPFGESSSRTKRHPWGDAPLGDIGHEDVATRGAAPLKHQLLPITAIATTTLALLCVTPLPVVGTNDDVRNLAIGASITLWLVIRADRNHRKASETQHRLDAVHTHLDAVSTQVEEIRQHTNIEKLLVDAGVGSTLTLPTPHGDIRSIPADVDGETVLAGVDESAHLADVIDLRRAMAGDGRAAQ